MQLISSGLPSDWFPQYRETRDICIGAAVSPQDGAVCNLMKVAAFRSAVYALGK